MLRQAFAPLIDLVYPPRCPLCGDGIGAQNGLCAECWGELVAPPEGACRMCGLPGERATAPCRSCLAEPPPHDGITAATLYTDMAKRLVISFKHGRKIALAPMLARLIAARLPQLEGPWTIVPVPLHRWRLWQRGFNQSALLASELGKVCDLPVLVDGLVRCRNTKSLSTGRMSRVERVQALAGAIVVDPRHQARIRGTQVLLVDDVMTSGATTDACIAALRQAGAKRVRIACFSRVERVTREPGPTHGNSRGGKEAREAGRL